MATILIVDDEKEIQDVLKEYCEYSGYNVFLASDGYEALEQVEQNKIDLILMDIMMPNLDGYKAVAEIKKLKNIPVIMMSAKSEEYDKLKGFQLGVDDYVTKPFSPKEVMARVKALLKRSMGIGEKISIGDIEIETDSHKVLSCGKEISLTNKEYDLLLTLIKNKNIVMSREKLLNEIWGLESESDARTVDAHIKMLRANLLSSSKYIVTVHGVGYKFEV